jgi:hypothetical protein
MLDFEIGGAKRSVSIETLVIAGWTGRDEAAVERHIAELQALGVTRPRTVPCFYRVGANLLTQTDVIDVTGVDSSGEVEFVLVSLDDALYVGVGSDHTDRKVEAYRVTVSKQMCPSHKPDPLSFVMSSRIGTRSAALLGRARSPRATQEGSVANIRARTISWRDIFETGCCRQHGNVLRTLAVNGDIGGGGNFDIELEDRTLNRTQHTHTRCDAPDC